jgi:hypothetical protein
MQYEILNPHMIHKYMGYNVYFGRGPCSLQASGCRLDDGISSQGRVIVSKPISRPVDNCCPDGTVPAAVQ